MEKLEHNVATGEVKVVELSEAELEQFRLDEEARVEKKAEQKTASDAKAALLERLGITADEATLLLG
jgi:hypothetical protein